MALSNVTGLCSCQIHICSTKGTRLPGSDNEMTSNTTPTHALKLSQRKCHLINSHSRQWLTNGLTLVLVAVLFCSCLPQALGSEDKSNSDESRGAPDPADAPVVAARAQMPENADEVKLLPGRGPEDKDALLSKDPYANLVKEKGLVDLGFIHAFVASLSVIIVSELGDKTFFIAAIMAMRHSRLTVFCGAIGALGLMTVLSAVLGYATTVIPRWFTYYASSALFAIFGLKMIREGYYMSPDEGQEEYEEVQADLRKKEEEAEKDNRGPGDTETGIIGNKRRNFLLSFFSRIFLQSFTLTFLAEWGDRSQISTIILAARDEVIGVIIGGTLGHALCTGLAVIGGRFIAQRISIRTVTIVGGIVFIIFALSALIIEPDD